MLTWLIGDWRGPEAFDPAWEDVLRGGVWQYRFLDEPRRCRVRDVVAGLVRRKKWIGGDGLTVTDTMRVTISGVAGLMTLGLDEAFFFPKLPSLVLYPDAFDEPAPVAELGFLTDLDPVTGLASAGPRTGEAWRRGPVVLSWRAASRQARVRGRGRNLVLHELAHHLDGYNGDMDGVPHFDRRQQRRDWYAVSSREYQRLVGQARRREVTLLDHYGAGHPAEFFAVATECFFERPHALAERHRELFGLLADFYRQDPRAWCPRLPEPPPGASVAPRGASRRGPAPLPDLSHLQLAGADELFSHGVLLMGREEHADAERVFGEVIRRDPDDHEARQQRGEARLAIGDFAGAVRDAAAALQADARDLGAMLTHAHASLALGDEAAAGRMARRALREDPENPEALAVEGRLRMLAGDCRRAALLFRRVVARDPLDAEAHRDLAECLGLLGESDRADLHRLRAEQLDPRLED